MEAESAAGLRRRHVGGGGGGGGGGAAAAAAAEEPAVTAAETPAAASGCTEDATPLHLRTDIATMPEATEALDGLPRGAYVVWPCPAPLYVLSYVTADSVAHLTLGHLSDGTWYSTEAAAASGGSISDLVRYDSLAALLSTRKYLDAGACRGVGGSDTEPAPPDPGAAAAAAAAGEGLPAAAAAAAADDDAEDDVVFQDTIVPPTCRHDCQAALFAAVGVAAAAGVGAVATLYTRLAPAVDVLAAARNSTMGAALQTAVGAAAESLLPYAGGGGSDAACAGVGMQLRTQLCAVLPELMQAGEAFAATRSGDVLALAAVALAATVTSLLLLFVHTGKRQRISLSGMDADSSVGSGCNKHRVRWTGAFVMMAGVATAASLAFATLGWQAAGVLGMVEGGARPFVVMGARRPVGVARDVLAASLAAGATPWQPAVFGSAVDAFALDATCADALSRALVPVAEAPALLRIPLPPALVALFVAPTPAPAVAPPPPVDCFVAPTTPLRLSWFDGWLAGDSLVFPSPSGIARTSVVFAGVVVTLLFLNLASSDWLAMRRARPASATRAATYLDDDE